MSDESAGEEAAGAAGSDPSPGPDSGSDSDTDPGPDSGSDSDTDPNPDPDSGPDVDAGSDSEPVEPPAPGLSDDGILLFFVALGCLLAATTAYTTGQPLPIAGFAVLAGAPAAVAFLADVVSEFVPGTGLELLVGAAAVLGALFAVPGRHYVNIATLLVAAALVLWRVIDVEVRGAER